MRLPRPTAWPIRQSAGGECPEPDSAKVSWLAGAVPRPYNGRCRLHGAADCSTAYFQAARGLPPSLSPGVGLSLSQHVLVAPVLEMMERHKKLVRASVSGPL